MRCYAWSNNASGSQRVFACRSSVIVHEVDVLIVYSGNYAQSCWNWAKLQVFGNRHNSFQNWFLFPIWCCYSSLEWTRHPWSLLERRLNKNRFCAQTCFKHSSALRMRNLETVGIWHQHALLCLVQQLFRLTKSLCVQKQCHCTWGWCAHCVQYSWNCAQSAETCWNWAKLQVFESQNRWLWHAGSLRLDCLQSSDPNCLVFKFNGI